MRVIEQFKRPIMFRIYSFLTSLILSLSVLLSMFGALGYFLIQQLASATIVLGTTFELIQILMILQLVNRDDKAGWIIHRFAYVTLLVIILSFLSIIGGMFLSSFFIFGADVMIIPVIGYTVQASFGISLSSVSYHFLQLDAPWCW
ncbi:MAG: hypothetical protein GF309_00785 [Candidatus Lokiarchaeota archaeon]|nr:hypothetical protein [Candidatus Lokiarchaeota archaeon]